MNRCLLAVCCGLAAAAPLAAQAGKARHPKRPAEATSLNADTNSALNYYRYGMAKLEGDPSLASDALYWAIRLDPVSAEALYARRVAMLRADERRLIRYYQGGGRTRKEFLPMDSMLYRARMIQPFLFQDLDRGMIQHYYRAAIESNLLRRYPEMDRNELRFEVERYVQTEMMRPDGDKWMAGWLAFSERRMPDALMYFGQAIGKKHDKPWLHDERATVFFLTGQYDSAAAELRHALDEMQKEDDKELQIIYQPKAMLQYRLAWVMLRQNDIGSAKDALSRALEEDLSFYPAHMMLANMALQEGDTATALREGQMAVELHPVEALPYVRQAELLLASGDHAGATAALTKVVEMEPFYARPYLLLGRAAEAMDKKAEAVGHYQAYLARAMKGDNQAIQVRARIQALGGAP